MPVTAPEARAQLVKANRIRSRRAELKRSLKAGGTTPAAVIVDPPSYVLSMTVRDLLLACRGYGETKADRLLRGAGVSGWKTLEGLTKRQRFALRDGLIEEAA